MELDGIGGNKRVYHRTGASHHQQQQKVCYHWRAGKCTRHPCLFLHHELPPPTSSPSSSSVTSSSSSSVNGHPGKRSFNTWGVSYKRVQKTERVCNFWVQGSCGFGDKCRYLHSWSVGDGFSLLTHLEGHLKVVRGIALSADKLYSGSQDETVRVWNCQSGQCMGVVNVGGEVGCMMSEGPWVFVGITNLVKAWNTQTNAELSLVGPVGQVYALAVGSDLLFAGTQDATILAWKFNAATNNFEPAAQLKGHSVAVVSLVVGANKLFSGSMDHSIRVWSLETLQCIQILTEHASVVMSLLCWDQFLLSSSLDQTIKVWAATESGSLQVMYTHSEEHGVLTMCGMLDLDGKPVLLCSCNDNTVRLYDLPSFSERGKIFSKQEIRAIQTGPGGLFFTGDGTGQVRVWQCVAKPTKSA